MIQQQGIERSKKWTSLAPKSHVRDAEISQGCDSRPGSYNGDFGHVQVSPHLIAFEKLWQWQVPDSLALSGDEVHVFAQIKPFALRERVNCIGNDLTKLNVHNRNFFWCRLVLFDQSQDFAFERLRHHVFAVLKELHV